MMDAIGWESAVFAPAALSAAYKTDPAATQKLLERAAAAIAPT